MSLEAMLWILTGAGAFLIARVVYDWVFPPKRSAPVLRVINKELIEQTRKELERLRYESRVHQQRFEEALKEYNRKRRPSHLKPVTPPRKDDGSGGDDRDGA